MAENEISTHAGLFDLTGKYALVTGGTRGIGMMMARGPLQAGGRVVISPRKPEGGPPGRGRPSPLRGGRGLPAHPPPPQGSQRPAPGVTPGSHGAPPPVH